MLVGKVLCLASPSLFTDAACTGEGKLENQWKGEILRTETEAIAVASRVTSFRNPEVTGSVLVSSFFFVSFIGRFAAVKR